MQKERFAQGFLALCIAICIILLHFYRIDPFESFSLRFNDVNFVLQDKPISDKVVFVAVDEPSVNHFGRWPWDRSVIAKGVEKLQDAKVVLMDMIFSESTDKENDTALAEALSMPEASVCGFFLRKNATQKITDEELELLADSSLDLLQSQIAKSQTPSFIAAPFAEMNIATIMQGCTLSGSFTTLPAQDHLFRSYPVAVYYQDSLYPSLGIQGLRLYFDSDIKRVDAKHLQLAGKKIEVDEHGFTMLNFYKLSQYKIISFLDLYNGKVDPSFFKDKIVILGITEVGAGDIAPTPIGNIPGPLLHYTFMSNFLQGELITHPKDVEYMLILLMAFVPFILLLLIQSVLWRSVANIAFYVLLYIFVRYLFVAYNIYIDLFYPLISLILSIVMIEVLAFYLQQKKEKFLKDAFSSYLSEDLMKELIKNPDALRLGGEKKELTILFSDIRSFTSISESMKPEDLIKLLNRYFTPMTNAVLEKKGMLDKYIGDAVMAFFNAPIDVSDHADKACECALLMIERLNTLNEMFVRENLPEIHIGIGINTAEVIVGNMGSDTRFNYTVIGDGVNLASRVEGLTKNYGTPILITEFTVAKLQKSFLYRKIEPVQVKGKEEPVLLYELMADTIQNQALKLLYDKALEVYISGELEKAKLLFTEIVREYNDSVSSYFLQNIHAKKGWGVHKMTTK
ncbi:Adenylate cyclase [hydrothermal vent metagenome]|uniref:Adenylate cyclase n=1 Tax=hydrothermal vent metagenome TaxID=652676 RepID=A0A1W1BKK6_9ZZZZ